MEVHSSFDGSTPDSEKNFSESIKVLKNQVKNLEINLNAISSQLTEERTARYALQAIIKHHVLSNYKDFDTIEWPTIESNILT